MRRTWFLLTLTAALVATVDSDTCGTAPALKRTRRIINGDRVRPHQFPWTVSIQVYGEHVCGGSLISQDYVVTAAHCFLGYDAEVEVVIGLHHLGDNGIRVSGRAIIHPEFVKQDVYDIALVHLSQPVTFGAHVQPICLPDGDSMLQEDEAVVTTGWGLETTRFMYILLHNASNSKELEENFQKHSEITRSDRQLQQVTLSIWNIDKCNQLYHEYYEWTFKYCETHREHYEFNVWCRVFNNSHSGAAQSITEDAPFLCGISDGHMSRRQAACNGDSGGPLMKQSDDGSWVLVGVASKAPYDCQMLGEEYPQIGGFFADVSFNLAWINQMMNEQVDMRESHSARNKLASSFVFLFVLHLLPNLAWSVLSDC